MIRHERARLSSTFRELCVLSLLGTTAPLAVLACDETTAAAPLDASTTTTEPDATVEASAPVDAALDARVDAALDPCAPVAYDAGPVDGDADAAVDFCANLVRLPCGVPKDVVPRDQCIFTLNDCDRFCQGAYFNCHAWDDSCFDGSIAQGPVTVDCVICLGGPGRRPRGLETPNLTSPACGVPGGARANVACRSPLGDAFADMAHLEAASVHSFRMLRRDLEALGAPRELTRAAARAMRDEARHARVMQRLARRHHGKAVPKVRVRPTPRPSLEAFALENAVEGCVHETYAALLATWQSTHATDADIASAMDRIAHDETDHAALAWAVSRFVTPRLTPKARARIAIAVDQALTNLEHAGAVRGSFTAAAGLPSRSEQQQLARALRARLWPEACKDSEARGPHASCAPPEST